MTLASNKINIFFIFSNFCVLSCSQGYLKCLKPSKSVKKSSSQIWHVGTLNVYHEMLNTGILFFFLIQASWAEKTSKMCQKMNNFGNPTIWQVFGRFLSPGVSDQKKKSIPEISITWHKFRVPTCHIYDELFFTLFGGFRHFKYPCGQLQTQKIEKIKNMLILFEASVTRKQHEEVIFLKNLLCETGYWARQGKYHAIIYPIPVLKCSCTTILQSTYYSPQYMTNLRQKNLKHSPTTGDKTCTFATVWPWSRSSQSSPCLV